LSEQGVPDFQTVKWSFSSLKDYVNCPKQYHHIKVLRDFTKKITTHLLYGSKVHKAIENYSHGNAELPKNYARFKPAVDSVLEIPGERFIEHKMAITNAYVPCDFYDPKYWVRGIADLLIVDDDTAYVVDYKTGSNQYADVKQLKLMALMTFKFFPEVEEVRGGLLFVMHNSFVNETYTRDKEKEYWGSFSADLQRLANSFKTDSWPANPTSLCRWCPVSTCEFYGERE